MQPEIELGPVTLQTFGIMFALGFVAAGILVAKRFQELGKPVDWAYELIFFALIGGIVGARLDFIIENYDDVKDDLLGNLFSGSGLVWYGGAIGGTIGALAWAKWRGFLNLTLLDVAAPGLAIGYAVGRIGCQLSGDGDYGIPWDGPWAMSYEDGTVPTPPGVEVHPTPIYETISMLFVTWILWHYRRHFAPGILFAMYLVFAGLERFLIEFIRRNDDVLLGLTQAQVASVLMVAAGGIWIARKASRGELSADQVPAV
jgi:phosphatidylglycerol:prolipoprotein diacylglycerol transferase